MVGPRDVDRARHSFATAIRQSNVPAWSPDQARFSARDILPGGLVRRPGPNRVLLGALSITIALRQSRGQRKYWPPLRWSDLAIRWQSVGGPQLGRHPGCLAAMRQTRRIGQHADNSAPFRAGMCPISPNRASQVPRPVRTAPRSDWSCGNIAEEAREKGRNCLAKSGRRSYFLSPPLRCWRR